MHQSKAFYKKTRKGKVIKIVNEKYIREDNNYGYICGKVITEDGLLSMVSQAPHKQLLIIDTNVALHQIDILEYDCPATGLVVILQTVLQEIQHRNLAVYRRITNLLSNDKKQYCFFPNELSSGTMCVRTAGESMNDFNDRCIRVATVYYQEALCGGGEDRESDCDMSAVLITNDADNLSKAKVDGLAATNMKDFVSQYVDKYPELGDLLAHVATAEVEGSGPEDGEHPLFPTHIAISDISSGLKCKQYYRGTVRVSNIRTGTSTGKPAEASAYVIIHDISGENGARSVYIEGLVHLNRAVDGDVVAVQLCDKIVATPINTQTTGSSTGIWEETGESSVEALEGLPETATQDATQDTQIGSATSSPEQYYGKVVGVIKRNWRQYAGSIDMTEVSDKQVSTNDPTSLLFIPLDKRIPHIRISTRRRDVLIGQRILVQIDDWSRCSACPTGHYVRCLGRDGEKSVETAVLLHEYDVPCNQFTAEVMNCLPPPDWCITEELVAKRTDLRHLPTCSIDPPGCKDIDDALHCICIDKEKGVWEVGVHIADVGHFVHPDTPLDKEAAHRSTSTYLVERRLDMLPGYLTTELCSLRSEEDHLSFSVIWTMDNEANILDVRFCKSVIHSIASLTYGQAQDILDAPLTSNHESYSRQLQESVKQLNHLAICLKNKRLVAGALTLASPEVRFQLDKESGNPMDVGVYCLKQANALVEEWMLIANITVSKKTLRHYPTLSILRRHQPPSQEQLAPLVSAAAAVGVTLDTTTSKTLADFLDLAVNKDDKYFNTLLRILSTRCMMPAQYFCSGEVPKEQWHHYGLAAPVYTHFTSPIRRYADLLVHRLLAAAIGVTALPSGNADRSKQQELCSHMNRRHKAAQYAQRASVNLHTLLFFKDKPSIERAYVLSVVPNGITVLVPRFGIESQIRLREDGVETSAHEDYNEHNGVTVEYIAKSHDAISHSLSIVEYRQGRQSLRRRSLQVFQAVCVCIEVVEEASGHRTLAVQLVSTPDDEVTIGPLVLNASMTSGESDGGESAACAMDLEVKVAADPEAEDTDEDDQENNAGKRAKLDKQEPLTRKQKKQIKKRRKPVQPLRKQGK